MVTESVEQSGTLAKRLKQPATTQRPFGRLDECDRVEDNDGLKRWVGTARVFPRLSARKKL